ncbi:MAG: VCBS repeat-containing protein [Planctomycetaceae bacterium]|nr:VCBS repeat-containing protein [Planctomycetaceae bacterium]MCB9953435.1 VCBS repeat-containing protein [Planctomycetaceae bacterium]
MTSVTYHEGNWYLVVTTDGPDGIFRISEDGSSVQLFSTIEMFDRADQFNHSEIAFHQNGSAFVAHSTGLVELNSSGQFVREMATGDFNGVAAHGNELLAARANGTFLYWGNVLDSGDVPVSIYDAGTGIKDVQFGQFGEYAPGWFAITNSNQVNYWQADAAQEALSLPEAERQLPMPYQLFSITGLIGKIDLKNGVMFAGLEQSIRIDTLNTFDFESVDGPLSIAEGGQEIYGARVHLTSQPLLPFIANIARVGGDASIAPVESQVTFLPAAWRADAYLKFTAAEDADTVDGTSFFEISGGGAVLPFTLVENDNDASLGVEIRQSTIAVREGRTNTFQVRLTGKPTAPSVTLTTSRIAGDADLFVEGHAQLTINSQDWYEWKWVSIGSTDDADTANGTATFRVTAEGIAPASIVVSEIDAGPEGAKQTFHVALDDFRSLPLQGEQEEFSFYNLLRGDRGIITDAANNGSGEVGRGFAEARVDAINGFAGMFNSLNHPLREGRPLNFAAILPEQIVAAFQYSVTGIRIFVEGGQGELKVELKDSAGQNISEELRDPNTMEVTRRALLAHNGTDLPNGRVVLDGGSQLIELSLNALPENVQELTWTIDGAVGNFVRIQRIELVVEGPEIGYLEPVLWTYSSLLANFDRATGLTPDRAAFGAGDFDGTNTSGGQAAAAAIAYRLGFISEESARDIVSRTRDALLDLQQNESVAGIIPHFIRTNIVVDNLPPAFAAVGGWTTQSTGTGFHGNDYLVSPAGDGSATASWQVEITRPGTYELFARWVDTGSNATNATYLVTDASGSTSTVVNQSVNADAWVSLGNFDFEAGPVTISLSNLADGNVIADAIRLEGPPHIVPNTEYSTVDSIIGFLGTLLASEALGLDTTSLEQAFRNIDWAAITLTDGTISHGFRDDGTPLINGWDYFGTESLMIALAQAASTGTLPAIPHIPHPLGSFNGSGFIDEMLWAFVGSINVDSYGASWTPFRAKAAAGQVAHYDNGPLPFFGASAAEPAIPSQMPVARNNEVAIPYVAYGINGALAADEDGSAMLTAPVAAPHDAGLIWRHEPAAAQRMWDAMINAGILSPLNQTESVVVQQWGDDFEIWSNALKGSWNQSLLVLGAGAHLLGNNNPLIEASRTNSFISNGLGLLTSRDDVFSYDDSTGQWRIGASSDGSFTNSLGPKWNTAAGLETFTGDFNGDRLTDIAGWADNGVWSVGLNNGAGGFSTTEWGSWEPEATAVWTNVSVADFNGDGKADVAGLNVNGQWVVGISDGVSFTFSVWGSVGADYVAHAIGDFNGDGRADIANLHNSGNWWVHETTWDAEMEMGTFELDHYGRIATQGERDWRNLLVGDFNGDCVDDILIQDYLGNWFIGDGGESDDGKFSVHYANRWDPSAFAEYFIGDFNGDGYDDMMGRTHTNVWWGNRSLATTTGRMHAQHWGSSGSAHNITATTGDFNGDGFADMATIRGGTNLWFVLYGTYSNRFMANGYGPWSGWTGGRLSSGRVDGVI